MNEYQIFWGDSHDNTYTKNPAEDEVNEVYARAKSHLDFYGMAYYTAVYVPYVPEQPAPNGTTPRIMLENWKDKALLDREYAEVKEAACKADEPGRFIAFAGYEWQGTGVSGDHNVFSLRNDHEIYQVDTIEELYEQLQGQDVIAIPHHIGYLGGQRGRDWGPFDERISPFCEIFSVHGCSETDEEVNLLRKNRHMGPAAGGSTYQDALDCGHHVGCVGSTDNWGRMPGCYSHGLMACLAPELTREAIWEAMLARRVYGVTGDRIALDFRVDGAEMGRIIQANGAREIRADVVGEDAIDRIELLRNGRVIATHCHQGTWEMPAADEVSRWKFRLEVGWGPGDGEMVVPTREWSLEATLGEGTFVGWKPGWLYPGQSEPVLDGQRMTCQMVSDQASVGERWQNNVQLEIEAKASDPLTITINGMTVETTVAELAGNSRVLWYRDESIARVLAYTGITRESQERDDTFHHMSHKAKLHRPIPAAGYTASLNFTDDSPLDGEANYRVRVEQRNGQRAWSSPVWVRP